MTDTLPPSASSQPRPFREPLRKTLQRTLTIAFVLTTILTLVLEGGSFVRTWLVTFPAVLWFPLGGHYVELAYLNGLRMRFLWAREHRYVARFTTWIVGGLPLGLGCWWTWTLLGFDPGFRLPWWWGMAFFPAVECVVHTILTTAGRPSIWNGRE